MKRIMTLCLLMAMAVGGVQAQKGMQGVGMNVAGNVGKGAGIGIGAGLKYQYNINNYFRLEPSITYCYVEEENYAFNVMALLNVDCFFLSPRALRPYFFTGGGFVNYKYGYNYSTYDAGVGLNAGLGLDWRITHDWSMQFEVGGCELLSDEDGAAKFNIGLTYNF